MVLALLVLPAGPLHAQRAPAQPPTEAPPQDLDDRAPEAPGEASPPEPTPTEPTPTEPSPSEPPEAAEPPPAGVSEGTDAHEADDSQSPQPSPEAAPGKAGAAAAPVPAQGTDTGAAPPTAAPAPVPAPPTPAAATAAEPNLSAATLPQAPEASAKATTPKATTPKDATSEATDAAKGIRQHDGFMFELGLLGDFHVLHHPSDHVATSRDGEPLLGAADATGTTGGLSIALGGTSGAVTMGGRFEFSVGERSVLKVDGQRALLEKNDGVAFGGLDFFLRWHLVHHLAVEVAAGLGTTIVSTDLAWRADDPDIVPGGGGIRVQAGLMKLFWLGEQWSTGIRFRTVLSGGSGASLALGLGWLVIYQ